MNIRWRLTFLYTLATSLAVLAALLISQFAYHLGSTALADRSLMQAADSALEIIESQKPFDLGPLKTRLASFSDGHEGLFLALWGQERRILYQSDPDLFQSISLPSAEGTNDARVRIQTISYPTRGNFRMALLPIPKARETLWLALGTTLPSAWRLLSLWQTHFISSLFLVLVGLMGWTGWMVAGRALAPLEALTTRLHQFASNISHQLKTPLTVLRGEIEVALRGQPSLAETKDVLKSNLAELEKMSVLVEEILAFSKMEHQAPVSARMTRIDEALQDVARQAVVLAKGKGLQIDVQAESISTFLPPVRLEQALLNVLDNAVKHTPAGGRITLRAASESDQILIQIQDTGPGVPSKDLHRLFERGRSSTGTGLGLSLARALIESLKGSLEVQSAPGKGLTVRILLPLIIESAMMN